MTDEEKNIDLARALEDLIACADSHADAREAARKLLHFHGRQARAFELAAEDIQAQTGLGKEACRAIDMIDELSRYAGVEALGENPKLASNADAGAYFTALCRGRHIEHCYAACLDERKRLLSCRLVGKGTLDAAEVYVRSIAQAALRGGAQYVYLAHNHPGGGLRPSNADIELTRRAKAALALIGITLLDHLVVTDTAYTGILESGCL